MHNQRLKTFLEVFWLKGSHGESFAPVGEGRSESPNVNKTESGRGNNERRIFA